MTLARKQNLHRSRTVPKNGSLQLILNMEIKGEDVRRVTRNLLVVDAKGGRKQSRKISWTRKKEHGETLVNN